MAIDWGGVKAKLDEAATAARGEADIDAAMNVYNAAVVEALQLMVSTALVNGGTCAPNGPVAAATIS